MKSLLVLFLCGVTSAVALSKCSRDGLLLACNNLYKDLDFVGEIKTGDDMDRQCDVIMKLFKCELNYVTKCATVPYDALLDFITAKGRHMRLLCDKSNPVREKFLKNPVCYNRNLVTIATTCLDKLDFEENDYDDKDYCSKFKENVKCVRENAVKVCGEDAKDVIPIFQKPYPGLQESGCIDRWLEN